MDYSLTSIKTDTSKLLSPRILSFPDKGLANARATCDSLAQEPFRNIPVLWVISDDALGRRLGVYESAGARRLVLDWRYSFRRADVMVFPNYALPVIIITNTLCMKRIGGCTQ